MTNQPKTPIEYFYAMGGFASQLGARETMRLATWASNRRALGLENPDREYSVAMAIFHARFYGAGSRAAFRHFHGMMRLQRKILPIQLSEGPHAMAPKKGLKKYWERQDSQGRKIRNSRFEDLARAVKQQTANI